MKYQHLLIIFSLILLLAGGLYWYSYDKPINFNAQVRPILNKNCMSCHGGVKQQSGLSFLFPEEALRAADSGKIPIVPHQADKSELIKRITSTNPDLIMPPEGEPLQREEIEILTQWINQGAKWEVHWAYRPLNENMQPSQLQDDWITNEIDQFVLKKLKEEGLNSNEKANKSALLRRLSLDLTGLPPSIEITQQFLNDESLTALDALVDSLLASPHFGERWAAVWLDLARYADSKGYQKDHIRSEIWRYRDWVIDAFNKDMPFDQFTIEQLAGDLLPNVADGQVLATAFHRNTMTNDEGGTDDEEFRVAAVIDRLNTTFEIWQGTTISCVQCHSHPYDPIRHEEFYELYAFFNNTADTDDYSDAPLKELYSPHQKRLKLSLEKDLQLLKNQGDTISEVFQKKLKAFLAINPANVPILEELPVDSMRMTTVFVKGNWLSHGKEVQPDTPGFLPPFDNNYPKNRLGLAKWLVDENNPLTARIIVNRFWEQLFGQGLVTTLEDFGTQGELPSHPELLDWLAYRFVHKHQWRIKPFLKEIVLSSTYQQSSKVTEQKLKKDPYNRLLARGSRFRLSAEAIRDQALVVSGLFNPEVYGQSVMPHQPEGVWNVIRHVKQWKMDTTGNQHRRAIYTFWRRVSPYPSMMTFDVPSREVCVSRRVRTNTPLQALVTLNDPVFVEASEALARRMLEEGGNDLEQQIQYGFQLVLMRLPDEQRLENLMDFYDSIFKKYKKEAELEKKASLETASNSPEFKAMVNVANVLLNLDEVIMRG